MRESGTEEETREALVLLLGGGFARGRTARSAIPTSGSVKLAGDEGVEAEDLAGAGESDELDTQTE